MARRGPQPIGDVISELLARKGLGRTMATAEKDTAWREAIGEEWADLTRPGAIRRGVLQVTVANSTVLQELMFEKSELLARLSGKMGQGEIRDLKFRVGSLGS